MIDFHECLLVVSNTNLSLRIRMYKTLLAMTCAIGLISLYFLYSTKNPILAARLRIVCSIFISIYIVIGGKLSVALAILYASNRTKSGL